MKFKLFEVCGEACASASEMPETGNGLMYWNELVAALESASSPDVWPIAFPCIDLSPASDPAADIWASGSSGCGLNGILYGSVMLKKVTVHS